MRVFHKISRRSLCIFGLNVREPVWAIVMFRCIYAIVGLYQTHCVESACVPIFSEIYRKHSLLPADRRQYVTSINMHLICVCVCVFVRIYFRTITTLLNFTYVSYVSFASCVSLSLVSFVVTLVICCEWENLGNAFLFSRWLIEFA